jgi:hypothetical protein
MSNVAACQEVEIERLAQVLFNTMQKLGSSEECLEGWEGLNEYEQHLYRACIRELLRFL